MATWKDILRGVSDTAGVDLSEDFAAGQRERPAPTVEAAVQLDHEARAALPNRAARSEFDRLQRKKTVPAEKMADRRRKKDVAHLKKLQRRLEKQGYQNIRPREIKAHEWIKCAQITSDQHAQAALYYLDLESNRVAIGLFLQVIGGRGKLKGRSNSAVRARAILASLLLVIGNARGTRRNWDRYNACSKGLPVEAIQAALQDITTRVKPSRSTISGTNSGGPLERDSNGRVIDERTGGQVGYMRALKNARIIYTRQARWKDTEKPATRGWENIQQNEIRNAPTPSGWNVSLNRYWIVTDRWSDPRNDAERALLYAAYKAAEPPRDGDAPSSPPDPPEDDSGERRQIMSTGPP